MCQRGEITHDYQEDFYNWKQSLDILLRDAPEIPESDGTDTMAAFSQKQNIKEGIRRVQMAARDYFDPEISELEEIYGGE